MILETERLILRPWEEKDAEDLYKYASDPAVGPIAGWPPHRSVDESREIIRTVFGGAEAYAVCLKSDNRAVGAIELKLNGHTDMTEKDDECELGYWLGKPYWGQGLIPEAAGEMLRHAFADIGMTKVWCGYYEGNTKSKRVQEKTGFIYQWTTENLPVPLMNETRTGHVSALTKEEWTERIVIRRLAEDEIPAALDLAWKVFSEYESPVYSAEGSEVFRRSLHDENYLSGIQYYGAFDGRRLIGEIGIRADKKHICFFFVDGRYHRLGIGTRLFHFLENDYAGEKITLNSSPYGVPFYLALGFTATGEETTRDGIRFTPMEIRL